MGWVTIQLQHAFNIDVSLGARSIGRRFYLAAIYRAHVLLNKAWQPLYVMLLRRRRLRRMQRPENIMLVEFFLFL